MNFIDIYQPMQTAVNTLGSMENGLTERLVCSSTINLAILTAILLGAVRLVAPSEPNGRSAMVRRKLKRVFSVSWLTNRATGQDR